MACNCAESDTDTCLLHILLSQHHSALHLLRLRGEREAGQSTHGECGVQREAVRQDGAQPSLGSGVCGGKRKSRRCSTAACTPVAIGSEHRHKAPATKKLRTVMPLAWGSRFRRSSADGGCTCAHQQD